MKRATRRWTVTAVLAVTGMPWAPPPSLGAVIWYADDDAPLGGDGTTWNTAFRYVQDALAVASPGDEVRIASGTYRPDRDEAGVVIAGDRAASFLFREGVMVFGGYRGCPAGDCSSGDPDERDISVFETILSGDLADDDGADFLHYEENSHHVARSWGGCFLDGLTLTGGNADTPPAGDGGGLNAGYGPVTVRHCTIRANRALGWGGGMYSNQSSALMVLGCRFLDNHGGQGGGLTIDNTFGWDIPAQRSAVIGCRFEGNFAYDGGGLSAMLFEVPPPPGGIQRLAPREAGGPSPQFVIVGCVLRANSAVGFGGGAYISAPYDCANTVFAANVAGWDGGAIWGGWWSPIPLRSCTLAGNTAYGYGGAVASEGGSFTLGNCIVWQNTALLGDTPISPPESATMSYCCVQGGWAGAGNFNTDPLLDPAGRIRAGSPCIDAGSNLLLPTDTHDLDSDGDTEETIPHDVEGRPRLRDDLGTADTGTGTAPLVDVGAYEFQSTTGDLNLDGQVDLIDLAILAGCMAGPAGGMAAGCEPANLDGHPSIDLADFAVFQAAFGAP